MVYDCLNVGVAFHCIAASIVSTKFVHSEKATKFYEISILLLSTVLTDKSIVKILQNFVCFSEYMNFTGVIKVLVF